MRRRDWEVLGGLWGLLGGLLEGAGQTESNWEVRWDLCAWGCAAWGVMGVTGRYWET